MCEHNTRSLALRKHFWLKLDPTSLQAFSLSDLHHACRHEVREGYEEGQEACSTSTKGHERHEEGPVYFLLLHLPQPYTM